MAASDRVVVLGAGAPGEAFVAALRRLDPEVPITLVERELVGGECTYWACMPSKTLLRAPELVAAARRAPGAAEALTGTLDAAGIFGWRDAVVDRFDDSGHAEWLAEQDIELVRGAGRIVAPGRVAVDGDELTYGRLVIATGSVPNRPPISGLSDVDVWTSRDATSASEVPESLLVLGGGPVGCELAQFYARLGSRVVLVTNSDRLLPHEDAEAAAIVGDAFADDGIELRLNASLQRVEPGIGAHLAGGERIEVERVLIATGRRPNTENFGFEQLGVRVSKSGIEVDERLRAADGVWAVGDVTGVALFTHVGKYQARVAAADLAGKDVRADYRAIPRVTFTDPPVASVGTLAGDEVVEARWRLAARASTYERPRREGFVKLVADRSRRVLVGAVAVGPEAGEWIQQLTLAIRAEVPLETVRDTIQPYPTFSEAIYFAARELPL